MNRLIPGLFLLLATHGMPTLADHPSSLDHLLRQVEDAHRQDAQVRKEREQRFLSAHDNQKALLKKLRARVPHSAIAGNNSGSNTQITKRHCRPCSQN